MLILMLILILRVLRLHLLLLLDGEQGLLLRQLLPLLQLDRVHTLLDKCFLKIDPF